MCQIAKSPKGGGRGRPRSNQFSAELVARDVPLAPLVGLVGLYQEPNEFPQGSHTGKPGENQGATSSSLN